MAVVALMSQPAAISAQAGSTTDKKPAAASPSQAPDKKAAPRTPEKMPEAMPPLPPPGPAQADKPQAASGVIGSVNVPHKVMGDGQPLGPGTYSLRVSSDPVTPVVGQTVEESKWIEFVQGGQVKAKVLATVVTNATAKQIADRGVPPAGATKIQTLKGNDYLRIWIVHGPTTYLIHLANATM
jgi:hypothetical protein